MASKFALQVAERLLKTDKTAGAQRLAANVDVQLHEVREVLNDLIDFSNGVIAAWEIRPSAVAALDLKRARALRDQLSTDSDNRGRNHEE